MATRIAELENIVAQIGISMNELVEVQKTSKKEADEFMKASKKDMDEFMNESKRNMDEFMKASKKDLDQCMKELAEVQRDTALSLQETQRVVRETQRDIRKSLKELSGNVGGVNQRLGEIIELVVLPGMMSGMNTFGHKFTISSTRKKFSKNGKQLAEVDSMLENGSEVMVVEVKSRFRTGDMNKFLEQLEILRKNEKITGVAGKIIYAAAAGIGFDPEARKIAVKNGIYIVNISADYYDEKLKIVPPAKGKVGKW